MTTVFLSGSRRLSRLNVAVRSRVDNMIRQNFFVVVGDANGADKAFQKYLAEQQYPHVTVYCSGGDCRNNVGQWPVKHVPVDSKVKGRAFYVAKDRTMAREADYGFILWDGESVGAFGNLIELIVQGKNALVYLSPEKTFYRVSMFDEVRALLETRPPEVIEKICSKLCFAEPVRIREENLVSQLSLFVDP